MSGSWGKRILAVLAAVIVTAASATLGASNAAASPGDEYTGTHFGLGNLPPGCAADGFARADNACYHMRTGMNGLDSPEVDVLLMVPASPTAARDMRIMREAVEMWNGGIHYLAPQMGVPWMKNMHFHISTDIESATSGFVTYPVVDPEIVVIATNPVGGAGIGVDPIGQYHPFGMHDAPCTGIKNPFDVATFQNLPGFNHHGDERGATVTEDCGGAGGNVCFAINTAIDPTPPDPDVFNLFDLVAHEFGHCLTIGHVGDGAEGPWSKVPTNDIMSYNADPPGLNKCVSTLDVEGIAVTQSHYLDTNGDGLVNASDRVNANEKSWDSTKDHFQVQNPRDHFYASGTGSPMDCPQPDLGLTPGKKTNWQPAPKATSHNDLTLNSPSDGAHASNGEFRVRGTVAHVRTDAAAATTTTSTTASTAPPPSNRGVETVRFHHAGGNHFTIADTDLGLGALSLLGLSHEHTFTLNVPASSDVAFSLGFTDVVGASDLDLSVKSAGYDSGSTGATQSNPERVTATDVKGKLTITVDPYLIADPGNGVDYTLTAVITPRVGPRADLNTMPPNEHVRVYLDSAKAWVVQQVVDTTRAPANFDMPVYVARGHHSLRVEWERFGKIVATKTITVSA